MTDERTAILFLAHQDDPEVFDEFRNLKTSCAASYEVFLIFHQVDEHAPRVPADLEKDLFVVTEQDIRALDLPYYSPKNSNFIVYEGGQIYFGNADFLQLCFFSENGCYDYYWCVEYDVRFTGRWRDFFDAFKASQADLLSTTIVRYEDDPDWAWWHPHVTPDGPLENGELLRSFNPVYRLSKRASAFLIEKYQEGWCAHYELLFPTLFHRFGLAIEDIGGRGEFVPPGRENRFYENSPRDLHLFPGTFRYRPVMARPGRRRNTLWHPVKPHKAAGLARVPFRRMPLWNWLRVMREKVFRSARG